MNVSSGAEAQFWATYAGGPVDLGFGGNLANVSKLVSSIQTGSVYFDLRTGLNGIAAGDAGAQPGLWQIHADRTISGPVTLPVLAGNNGGNANCIDAIGQAAGNSSYSVVGSPTTTRATLWKDSAAATDLGSLANNATSITTTRFVIHS